MGCLAGALLLGLSALGQTARTDTLPRPTAQQYAWQERERLMFVHFGMATWEHREYDNHSVALSRINPTALNTDQWCRVAKSWGAKEIIFVAKHVGGFCWWPTQTTDYGVRNIPWKHGKGDVLAMVAASCRKYGLKLGIYIYPGDDRFGAGIGSGGRTKDPKLQAAYTKIYREQLKEVLSRYGTISEVWFDGSCVIDVSDILRKYAKKAVIFQGPEASIRWAGNEDGVLDYPMWYTLKEKDLKTGVATERQSDPDGDAYAPMESDVTLYNHFWFWSPKGMTHRRSLPELMHIYDRSVGLGGELLLDSTPDTTGLIPEPDVQAYAAFGRALKARFAHPLARSGFHQGGTVLMRWGHPIRLNESLLEEDYCTGQRIRRYVLEGLGPAGWHVLDSGQSVGRKKLDVFPMQPLKALRLRVLDSRAVPRIRAWYAYRDTLWAGPQGSSGKASWQDCGSYSARQGRSQTLRLELIRFMPVPGQYELRLVASGATERPRVLHTHLEYENGATLQAFLQQEGQDRYLINRTAQVTSESRCTLELDLQLAPGASGRIQIRRL